MFSVIVVVVLRELIARPLLNLVDLLLVLIGVSLVKAGTCGATEGFHGGSIVRWSTREWDFFLEDLAKHHLHPTRSTVILNFINGFSVGTGLTPEVRQFMDGLGTGARLGGLTVQLAGDAWLKSVQQMKSRPPTPPWVAEPVMRFIPEDSDYCRGLGKDVRGASHTRGRHDAHASK